MNDEVRDTVIPPVRADDLLPKIYGNWNATVHSSLCDTVAMDIID